MSPPHTMPLPKTLSVRALILRPILDYFDEYKGKKRTLLYRCGLSEEAIEDPYAPIPLAAYLSLFEQAAEMAEDPIFGARLGFNGRPGNLAPIGLRVVQSSTIRRALVAMASHTRALQTGTLVTLEEDGPTLALSYLITAPVELPARQDAEFSLAVTCRLIRLGFSPRWRPIEIQFRHPRLVDPGGLEQLFGAPVLFSAPSNRIVLSAAEADRPYRDEDDDLIAMTERHLADLAGDMHRSVTLTEQVEALIAMFLGVKPVSLETVAAALPMSPRSLQRRLSEEGQSLSALLQASRQSKAAAMLQDGSMSVEAIAAALGYADGTAFWRAWRGWTGKSPTETRQSEV